MDDDLTTKKRETGDLKDIIVIFLVIIIILVLTSLSNMFENFHKISNPEGFNIIEFFFVLTLFSLAFAVFSRRRLKELREKQAKQEKQFRELAENVNRLRNTVDLSPDAIIIHRNSLIIFANKAAFKLFNAADEGELIGKNVVDLIHYSYVERVKSRIEDMSKYMKSVPVIDITVKRLNGSYVDVEVASTPVKYHNIPHVITIIRDITERKRFEERLQESEQRLMSIMDNTTAVVFLKDLNGYYLMINRQFENLFSVTRERIKGKTDYDIFPKDMADVFRGNDLRVIQDLKPLTIEERAPHPDGIHTYIAVKFPLYNAIGYPYAVCGIATDITEQKHAEETRSRLATIVDVSEDAIISYDFDGKILTWNPGAERIYGYQNSEIIGNSVSIVIPEDSKDDLSFIIRKITTGQRLVQFETKRVRKDGTAIDVSLSVSPIKDITGNIVAISSISRDITYKKKIENELRMYAEELAMYNEELYVFSYAASHDLQEPLRTIQTLIRLLNEKHRKKLGRDIDEYLDSADDGVTRMYRLITDFLMYSRVGTTKSPKEEVDCNNALNDALENLKIAIKESKASIKQYSMPKVYANKLQVTQVFQNLVSNSIKYQGEKKPVIEISAEKKENMWEFSVKDNGIGIEQWFSERIFVVFQKLHDYKKYPGSGIGLALCKRIIEKHGGKIWFESQIGKGTTFFFTLPAKEEKSRKRHN